MAKRVSEEIDGVDIFTYDTDLLAAAQELRKPALLERAKRRNYPGLWKLNKLELAIIYADTLTAERDEQRKLPEINAQMTETLDEVAPAPRPSAFRVDAGAIKPTADEVAEMYEQAAAIDEKRTITRAFLSTPAGVVLTWDEIEQGYLDAMAERDRIEHNQAVRAEQQRVDDLLSLLNNPPTVAEMIKTHPDTADVDDLGRRVQTTASGHLISLPAPADAPRDLDIWLEPGVVLVGPQTGDRYRFLRWDGGWGVVRHEADGTEMRIARADVTLWQYLPKASAEGVAAAKRRVPWRETFVMHERTGQRYRVLGMDNIVTGKLIISHDCGSKCSEHERAVSPDVLQWDYIACDENGNVQPLPRNSLNRRSAPAYAVGDRVRWTEDRRPMFVRSVTPTGAYVAPTMDGPLAAFAASEDLSPEPGFFDPAGMARAQAQASRSLDTREAQASLQRLRKRLAWLVGYFAVRGNFIPVRVIAAELDISNAQDSR